MKLLIRYLHTLKYLRWKQIYYRFYYYINKKFINYSQYYTNIGNLNYAINKIPYISYHQNKTSFDPIKKSFSYLNLEYEYDSKINWDYAYHGKLFTYNLNYFDFLHQSNASTLTDYNNELIEKYCNELPKLKNANEAYPLSLRIINWVKYFCITENTNTKFNQSLFCQTKILSNKIEYHLLGNHLLENAFALYISGIYFGDKTFIAEGKKIINQELQEQILDDGAHFELSPMYHCIILYRVLDCIQFASSEYAIDPTFMESLKNTASKMLSWLSQIKFRNGDLPQVNDSAPDIAPSPEELLLISTRLQIPAHYLPLKESGYRKLVNDKFELFVDVGNIGPDYIPGHAHADTFSFILYCNGNPVIVDPSISTYEKNALRDVERSTLLHNTVTFNEKNSSDVWGGFRVGQRVKPKIIEDKPNHISANYYDHSGNYHKREFILEPTKVIIKDFTKGKNTAAHFHFSYDINNVKQNETIQSDNISLTFKNESKIEHVQYMHNLGYNHKIVSQKTQVFF